MDLTRQIKNLKIPPTFQLDQTNSMILSMLFLKIILLTLICFIKIIENNGSFGKNIPILHAGTFNIQKYEIGGHVKRWHTERDSDI